jgi:hypothetical protein
LNQQAGLPDFDVNLLEALRHDLDPAKEIARIVKKIARITIEM